MKEVTLKEVLENRAFKHFILRLLKIKGVKSVNIVGGIVYRQRTKNDIDVVIETDEQGWNPVWEMLESYPGVYNPVKEFRLIKVGGLELDFFVDECTHTKPYIKLELMETFRK